MSKGKRGGRRRISRRLVVGLAVRIAILVGLVLGTTAAARAAEQQQRDATCAAMGEVWQDDTRLPDGSFMPGQCVDPLGGHQAA